MQWDPLEQLSHWQRQTLHRFADLLLEFNRRINLISREDEANFFDHHVLHCLSITHRAFPSGAVVVDWGTGGGLPAIPLAVAMPHVRFIAIDAVGKKVDAVQVMGRRLGLDNLDVWNGRAEEFDGEVDYSVSRATASLTDLWSWHARAARRVAATDDPELWRPGLVCLKGGDLSREKKMLADSVLVEEVRLYPLLGKAHFRDKVILACSTAAVAGS